MTDAVPDPRFRDQLAEREEFAQYFAWAYGGEEYAESGSSREHWLEVADDFLARPFMRAYVEARVQAAADNDVAVEDVRAIAVALGLGGHARPYSAHELVQREILPALASSQAAANQRAAEEMPQPIEGFFAPNGEQMTAVPFRARTAALASPAPVPPDANGGEER